MQTVRDYIKRNKWPNIKYEIDGKLYESVEDVPESVKDIEILSWIYHMEDHMVLKLRSKKTHREEDTMP